ncbi:MAG: EAL domain-containing protein [Sciscionella sp.]|nr:EAL domain-containing protein [Sciscionella sp.]
MLARRNRLARQWAAALADTGYVTFSHDELIDYLDAMLAQFIDVVQQAPFTPAMARRIGTSLVDTHFTGVDSLAVSVDLLSAGVLPVMGIASDYAALQRVNAACGELAAGYAEQLRKRTLSEQEAICRAALQARDDARAALQVSESRFRAVFAGAGVGIVISDLNGDIVEANDALGTLVGYSADELRGRNIFHFIYPGDREKAGAAFARQIRGELDHYSAQRRLRHNAGRWVWTQVSVSLIRDKNNRPEYQLCVIEDVTKQRTLQHSLRHQATHDSLTGLANRVLMNERLAAIFAAEEVKPTGSGIGVCYLDVDDFKVINDSLGHQVGDELLVQVGKRLNSVTVEKGNSPAAPFLARMGGDEFVILVEDCGSIEELVDIAERAQDALRAPIHIAGHALSVSVSVGIVHRRLASTTAAELMRDVDITLYWAKADGRGRWAVFDAKRNEREVAKFTLSAMMPAALERGEFFVDYQPLVRLADEALIGVEALVRWQHPTFGRLGPDRFIELAEETGLIVGLGTWVLRTACAQASRWQRRFGAAAPLVSVNLSVRQVRTPGLVDEVRAILAETSLPPEKLQLELTESAIMETTGEPLDTLHKLAGLGVKIAIDDFGTGYSNLVYLRHLPVHVLKMDGTFMEGLRAADHGDPVDAEIVSTLVSLAHTLGLTVTAEGVETNDQARQLRDIGCDSGQGWLFSRPGSPEAIDALLAGYPARVSRGRHRR